MTMIDEEVLGEALRRAAEAFCPSEGATGRILSAARTPISTPRAGGKRSVIPDTRRGRMAMVAAAVALLVGSITASVESTSTSNSSSGQPLRPTSDAHSAPSPAGSGTVFGGSKSVGAATRSGVSARSTAPSGHSSASAIPSGSVGQSAKVEANGSIDLTIGDGTLQSVLGRLTVLASAEGGFVASTQAQLGTAGSSSPSSGTVVLQVPTANFGALVTQVQHYGHSTSVTTTSQDVTGQYVNLQARIAALQSSRQQYLTIMTRASSIGDILAVQSQIDTLQSDIDQLQGQVNVLDNETTYGTLTVALAEAGKAPIPPPRPRPAGSGLAKAWDKSVGGFVSGIEWIIRIAGPLLLVLLCLAGLVLLGRLTWRVSRRRML